MKAIMFMLILCGLSFSAFSQELVYVDNDSSVIFIDMPMNVGNQMQISTYFNADLSCDYLVTRLFCPIKGTNEDKIVFIFNSGGRYSLEATKDLASSQGEVYFKMTYPLYYLLSVESIDSIKYKIAGTETELKIKLDDFSSNYFITVFDQLVYVTPRNIYN